MTQVNLDDSQVVKNTHNCEIVLKSITAFPDQCLQAWSEASMLKFPAEYKQVKNILVCGMGGSRFTPIIIKELFKEEIDLPYVINDNYTLPKFVSSETLVILSSYSGTTEEVIYCGQEAQKMGAKITGLCLGGPLAEFFKSHRLPAYIFDAKHNPSGQPRIGVGYMTAGHMGLLYASSFLKISPQKVDQALNKLPQLLVNFHQSIPTIQNPAKHMAQNLFGKYPYYVTAEHLQGIGNAMGNKTNETAKAISSYRYIPELNHHLMEGLKFPEVLKQIGIFVFFTSSLYDRRIQVRFDITREVVEKNGLQTLEYKLQGQNKIEQALELIGFSSFMTMYLSLLYQQDPSVVPWVDYFKKRLKELSK